MGWLDGLGAGNEIQAATSTWTPTDDRWYTSLDGYGKSMAGRYVSTDLAMRVSAVYQCVTLRAKLFASLPFMIYRVDRQNNTRTEEKGHPLYDLLRYQPNKWQTAFDFWSMLHIHLGLRGNAYAEIVPGPRGFADRLEPLHPDLTQVEVLEDGTLRYRTTDMLGRRKVLLQDEVFHIRSVNAPGFAGVSPIHYARETIGVALAAEEFAAKTFSNGARPSGVVQIQKQMSDTAFERFKTEWKAQFSGLAGANATPILEEGAEFKPISMKADEIQFLATREFQIEEICRWFDVPPILLHHQSKSSSWGTGVEAIMLAFTKNSFNPLTECVEQAIRRDLILAPNIYQAKFDTEKLTQGDSKAQAEYLSRLVLCGVLTRNEAREWLGYDPAEGLDKPLTPSNTTTSDQLPGNGGGQRQQQATETEKTEIK